MEERFKKNKQISQPLLQNVEEQDSEQSSTIDKCKHNQTDDICNKLGNLSQFILKEPDDLIDLDSMIKEMQNNQQNLNPEQIYLDHCQKLQGKFFKKFTLDITESQDSFQQELIEQNIIHQAYSGSKNFVSSNVCFFLDNWDKTQKNKIIVSQLIQIKFQIGLESQEFSRKSFSGQIQTQQVQKGLGLKRSGTLNQQTIRKLNKKAIMSKISASVEDIVFGVDKKEEVIKEKCLIKKLQFFDSKTQKIDKEILTEQIFIKRKDKNQQSPQSFQVSTLKYIDDNKLERIYYFKRVFGSENLCSKLQLYSCSFDESQIGPSEVLGSEKKMKNFKYYENYQEQEDNLNQNFKQFNQIFSSSMLKTNSEQTSEEEFLKKQFVMFQEYSLNENSETTVKIFALNELFTRKQEAKPLVSTQGIRGTVQIFGQIKLEGKDLLTFVVRTTEKLYHFNIDPSNDETLTKQTAEMNFSMRPFQRVLEPIIIFHIIFKEIKGFREMQQIIYIINKDNEIEILSPLINDKLVLLALEDNIKQDNNIKTINTEKGNFKRIYHQQECRRNIIQETEKLQKILPLNQIEKNDQIVFFKDANYKKQTLIVYSPFSTNIQIIKMQRSLQKWAFFDSFNVNKHLLNVFMKDKQDEIMKKLSQVLREKLVKKKDLKSVEIQRSQTFEQKAIQSHNQQRQKTIHNLNKERTLIKRKSILEEKQSVRRQSLLDVNSLHKNFIQQNKQQQEFCEEHKKWNKVDIFCYNEDEKIENIRLNNNLGDEEGDSELSIELICYQKYRFEYTFIIAVENNQKQTLYVFIKKSYDEMQKIFQSNKLAQQMEQTANVFNNDEKESQIIEENSSSESYQSSFSQIDELKSKSQQKLSIQETLCLIEDQNQIKILHNKKQTLIDAKFSQILDSNGDFRSILEQQEEDFCHIKIQSDRKEGLTDQNFIPLLFQEAGNNRENYFFLYDISHMDIFHKEHILYLESSRPYLYVDRNGFNCFTICRTSDVKKSDIEGEQWNMARYQVFTFFQEKVGRMFAHEYLVINEESINQEKQIEQEKKSKIELIGLKQLLFSQALIQHCDFDHLVNSKAIPLWDSEMEQIVGCRLQILKKQQDGKSENVESRMNVMNLLDLNYKQQSNSYYKENNLYSLKTYFTNLGLTKFIMDSQTSKKFKDYESLEYILVSSSRLRENVIVDNIFNQGEIFNILEATSKKLFSMKVPDMEYLILNTFDDIKENYFFQPQYILGGKNICDICLSDATSVQLGIQDHIKNEAIKYKAQINHIERLIDQDEFRRNRMIDAGIYPKFLLINQDFNLNSTIQRATKIGASKSLKLLLMHIFDTYNTPEYQSLIMFDMQYMWGVKNSEFVDFLGRTKQEKEEILDKNFCNMEIPLNDINLPTYSDKALDFMKFKEIEPKKNQVRQLIEGIQSKIEQNQGYEYEVEYFYVNFNQYILGRKLKAFQSQDSHNEEDKEDLFQDFSVNDLHISQKIAEIDDQRYYEEETFQKFIDYQFIHTSKHMIQLFVLYSIGFIFCFLVSMIDSMQQYHQMAMNTCLFSQSIFLFIEFTQMHNDGLVDYFSQGWNIIDSFQVILFLCLYFFKQILSVIGLQDGDDTSVEVQKQIRLIIFCMAFFKMLFFIRIFEKYGSFVQMIYLCLGKLMPFMICYILFMIGFTVSFMILGMEIDEEVAEAKDLTYYEYALLQVFRTSMGELAMPGYSAISKKNTGFASFNILLMWVLWYVSVFFMLVIMLNFLIAEITTTYNTVIQARVPISYMQKAQLNNEYQVLMSYFKKQEPFQYIVFISSKEQTNQNKDDVLMYISKLKQFVQKQIDKSAEFFQKMTISVDILAQRIGHLENNYTQKLKKIEDQTMMNQKEFQAQRKSIDDMEQRSRQTFEEFQLFQVEMSNSNNPSSPSQSQLSINYKTPIFQKENSDSFPNSQNKVGANFSFEQNLSVRENNDQKQNKIKELEEKVQQLELIVEKSQSQDKFIDEFKTQLLAINAKNNRRDEIIQQLQNDLIRKDKQFTELKNDQLLLIQRLDQKEKELLQLKNYNSQNTNFDQTEFLQHVQYIDERFQQQDMTIERMSKIIEESNMPQTNLNIDFEEDIFNNSSVSLQFDSEVKKSLKKPKAKTFKRSPSNRLTQSSQKKIVDGQSQKKNWQNLLRDPSPIGSQQPNRTSQRKTSKIRKGSRNSTNEEQKNSSQNLMDNMETASPQQVTSSPSQKVSRKVNLKDFITPKEK